MKAKLFLLTTILAGYTVACFSVTPDTITVAMTGDIMMGTTYPGVSLPPKNGTEVFKDVKPYLQRATITVGNLEGTLLDGGKSTKSGGPNSYSFRTPTSYSHLLKEAGYSVEDVVETTVMLSDIADFAAMNEVYAKHFTQNCPARCAFQVAALPRNAKVEIRAVACK